MGLCPVCKHTWVCLSSVWLCADRKVFANLTLYVDRGRYSARHGED